MRISTTERTDQSSPQQQEDTPCIREVPTLDSESSCSPRKGQRSQQKAKSGKGPSGRRKGGSGKSVSDTPATAAGNRVSDIGSVGLWGLVTVEPY